MKTQNQSALKRNLWIFLALSVISVFSMRTVSAQDTATFLSDMPFLSAYAKSQGPEGKAYEGWDAYIKRDVNIDGTPIKLGGVTYSKGLYAMVTLNTGIVFDLGHKYTNFKTSIGIDDKCSGWGTSVFKVYCDGILAYTSPVVTWADPPINIDIDVTGVCELQLVTTDGGDGNACDWSEWANARLTPGIAQSAPFPDTVKMFHSGNSLTPRELVHDIYRASTSAGFSYSWAFMGCPGDKLRERWNCGTGPNTSRGIIMSGKYTHFDLQPNSAEYGRDYWDPTEFDSLKKYTKLYYDLAKQYNMKPYFYCYHWLNRDFPRKEQDKVDAAFNAIADYCGLDFPVIPCGRVIANVWEACKQGIITDWDTLSFTPPGSGIHPSVFGHYINALTHFATIYQQSPVGLPSYNIMYNNPTISDASVLGVSDESILKIQQIVWNTVKTYSHSKVDTTILPTADLTSDKTVAVLNSKVTFDASASHAVSGSTIIKYRWSFGDIISPYGFFPANDSMGTSNPGRTYPVYETTSDTVSHTYTKTGKFWARLVVVQDNGKTSSDFMIINITATADTVKPSVPANLTSSNITSVGFTLSWTASTDNVGVTGYDIFRNGVLAGSSATTSYNVTGLTANTTYAMTVKAKDGAGNLSEASTSLNVTTSAPDAQAPTAPTGLASSSVTTTSVVLNWTASTDNVGVTGYDIFRNGTLVGSSTTTTFSVTGLTAASTYSITVKAKDAAGNSSAASTALSVTTLTAPDIQAPAQPTGLTSSDITQTSFILSWTASTDNVGVVSYEVFKNGVSVGTTTNTTLNLSGLTANSTYSITVKAKDAAGNVSAASNILNVKTSPAAIAGIEEEISIYPNPVADVLNITDIPGSIVSIYDMNGILLIQKKAESEIIQMDVSNYSNGIYLIKISSNSFSIVVKVIKE